MPTNFTKTGLLLAVLTLIFVAMGTAIGGQQGTVLAFLVALATNAYALWQSDKMVLRMQRAQEVGPADAPQLYGIVSELSQRAGLPMPRVYVMDQPQPNAFATGRSPSSAAVCASTGLLDTLTPEEVAGVMAHELAHVRNRDTLTMTVAATIGGAISMLAQWLQFSTIFGGNRRQGGNWLMSLLAMLVAPFAAMLVQMAISRSREYQADRLGSMICGNPMWLASALGKIQSLVQRVPNQDAEAVPAMAPLFIVNPLTGRGFDNFFSTHPSTENRISELQRLAQEMAAAGTLQRTNDYSELGGRNIAAGEPARGPWSGPRGPWG